MNFIAKIFLIIFFSTSQAKAINTTDWLKNEIDKILNAYKNENFSNVEKFQYIENTIDNN